MSGDHHARVACIHVARFAGQNDVVLEAYLVGRSVQGKGHLRSSLGPPLSGEDVRTLMARKHYLHTFVTEDFVVSPS